MTGQTAPTLKFWMYHDTDKSTNNDRIQVQISTDGGVSYAAVLATMSRYDGSSGWKQHTVDLSAYAGQNNVRLGFLGISALGNDIYLDDVSVQQVSPEADLAITKSDSPDPVTVGNSLTYTIMVTNAGPSTATGVVLTETLPSGVTLASTTPSQGNCAESGTSVLVVICDLGNLSNGDTATVRMIVTPTLTGTIANTVSVTANVPDPNPANNTATQNTTVVPVATPTPTPTATPTSTPTSTPTPTGTPTATPTPTPTRTPLEPLFDARLDYLAWATSFATGDFNGDGIVDLVTGGGELLIGRGNGTFEDVGPLPLGGGVIAGDFNQDGKLDIASSQVAIALGNGDGTFQSLITQTVEGGGIDFVSGDFNKDGKLDLALPSDGGISVLLGNGDGTLQPPVIYAVGGEVPNSLVTGDFNHDGNLDLAGLAKNITILLGTGQGTFLTFATISACASTIVAKDITMADFNRDGHLDLASICYGNTYSLDIYLGNGNGTFSPSRSPDPANTYPWSVEAADINGDGNSDIVVTGDCASVLLGKGDGNFQTAVCYELSGLGYHQGIAVADFDGNGQVDLAIGDRAVPGFFAILLGKGGGTFRQAPAFDVGHAPLGIVSGDFNQDGNSDLAISNLSDSNISVLLGNGSGTFPSRANYPVGSSPSSIISADFNRDGKLDLAAATDAVSILIGNGDGTFQAAKDYAVGSGGNSVTAGDFNNDGVLDLAVDNGDGDILILRGAGDGTFQLAGTYSGLGWAYTVYLDRYLNWITSSDFNKDGKLDLAALSYVDGSRVSHGVSIFIGNGDLTFQPAGKYGLPGYPAHVISGDFNEDGIIDLATASAGQAAVSVLIGVGDGTFRSPVSYWSCGRMPVYLVAGDLNNDGHLDIAAANLYNENVPVLLGKGDGTFAEISYYGTRGTPYSIAIGDFDKDGNNDLAVAGLGQGTILMKYHTVRSVTLMPASAAQSGNPGTTITYTLRVTNTGNAADTFTLNVSGNSWTTTAPATVGPLGSSVGANVVVSVTIPSGAAGGATDMATVTATSQGDGSKSASSTLTTTATATPESHYEVFLPLVLRNP